MEKTSTLRPPVLWSLYAFAATAVASIALQNFIWVAVALFLFFRMKDRQKIAWPSGLFTVVTLIFLATFFLGALVGVDPANSFHSVHKTLTLLLIPLVGAIPLLLKDIKKLLLLYNYGAAFCAVHGIWAHFWLQQDRIYSFSGDKMVFGGMLMTSLLIQILFLKIHPRNVWHWSCFAFILWALLLTETRGAWIGCGAGLLVLGWHAGKKWVGFGLAALVLSYFLLPGSLQDRVKSITNLEISLNEKQEITNSTQPRLLIWISGLKMIKDHPWGVGQGNVEKVFPRYRLGALDRYEPTVPHLHNNILQVLAQNGWLGLAAYFFWIFSLLGSTLRAGFKGGEAGELNLVLLAVFFAVLVWGLTEYTFSHQFMNIQFFLLGLQINLWKALKKGL